jgi:ElaA protein
LIDWRWYDLEELSNQELYRLLAAREAVFVVEQACAYQELDGLDGQARHLVAWDGEAVTACLRLLAPGVRFAEPSIGRLLTGRAWRGQGLGREAVTRALEEATRLYPGQPIRISGQTYLEHFYAGFGFERVSEPYLEDGIPHVEMLLP